jgi:hypothetical protein
LAWWEGGPGLGGHIGRARLAMPDRSLRLRASGGGRRRRRLGRRLRLRRGVSTSWVSLCPGRRNTEPQCDDNSKDRSHGVFPPYCRDRHLVWPRMTARGSAMPVGEGKIAKLKGNADKAARGRMAAFQGARYSRSWHSSSFGKVAWLLNFSLSNLRWRLAILAAFLPRVCNLSRSTSCGMIPLRPR